MISKRAIPYAKALYALGEQTCQLELWLEELNQLEKLLNKYPGLMKALTTPQFSEDKREALFKKIFQNQLPLELFQFCVLLQRKNHFEEFFSIVEDFKKRVHQKWGIIEGVLSTPFPIDEATKTTLVKKWEQILNKKISLEEKLDKSLIGGGCLKLGNDIIDFSLKGKLQKLKTDLMKR